MPDETTGNIYERRAAAYDRDRSRTLQERGWLDRFLAHVRPGGLILDIGCGMGEPIARYLVEAGRRVVGIDLSESLIALGRARFPGHEWFVADMRTMSLGRRFDGLLAWDSFFHLGMDEQRAIFPRFAAHALPGAPLLFTSGPSEGESMGEYHGEPLYHASLDAVEYRARLESSGFTVRAFVGDDPDCGGHTVWLATFDREIDPATPRRGQRAGSLDPNRRGRSVAGRSRAPQAPADPLPEEERGHEQRQRHEAEGDAGRPSQAHGNRYGRMDRDKPER
jgi:SAM-dependent methyltransferase